jgi:5-formyltetrahydrofolate cyclo-ligase
MIEHFAEKNIKQHCIGLAYSFQMEDDSFEEKHDIRMDYVITQKEVWTN